MWYCPEKYVRPIVDVNKESLALKGELGDRKWLWRTVGAIPLKPARRRGRPSCARGPG